MTDVLTGVAGATMILLVASDIFRSLLVPRASTRFLRLGPLLTITLFAGWQAMAGRIRDDKARQSVRATLAPLMLVVSFAVWVAVLILGFGLVFWSGRANFSPRFRGVGDAIYAAGSAFSTLGIDGQVSGASTRLVVLICSTAGLAIVTVVATFVISIQGGFSRRETLVLRLEAHVTLPPAGIAILETYQREKIVDRLGGFFDAWEGWAAEVATSHRAFPILLFFRSNDSRCEWLAALGAVLDAAALLDATVDEPPPQARAGAHFVLRTGARMIGDMARQFAVRREPDALVDAARFDEHRARLAKAGYALIADRDVALARFQRRRETYAASLVALATRLHIDVDERRAGEDDGGPQGVVAKE